MHRSAALAPNGQGVIVAQKERERKKFKQKCQEFFSTKWTEMRLRTQIILKLVLIIFLLFAIYMVVLIIIFEFYYKPDVLGHFKQELESVHALRTSNMTVSISSRFEAFDRLTSDNVGKVRQLLGSTQNDAFDPRMDLPFNYVEEKFLERCTTGVSNPDQYLINNFQPLFINLLKLKLGWQTNLEMSAIYVLFKGQGICAFYNSEEKQKARLDAFNKLPASAFTHKVFDLDETQQGESHLEKQTNFLGQTDSFTYGIWQLIPYNEQEQDAKIAISIQYEIDDLGLLMPQFVEQLKVPLIAIYDQQSHDDIFFQDATPGQHFKEHWTFTDTEFKLKSAEADGPTFTAMKSHKHLSEATYRAVDYAQDPAQVANFEDLAAYHLVETCVPTSASGEKCASEGYMMVVVGQEVYGDSPFTKEIERIMSDDVNQYYQFIVLIFCVVKLFLFCVLWNWLRLRVTDRMKTLTVRLQTNDQSDKHSYQQQKLGRASTTDTDQLQRHGSMMLRSTVANQKRPFDDGPNVANMQSTHDVQNTGGSEDGNVHRMRQKAKNNFGVSEALAGAVDRATTYRDPAERPGASKFDKSNRREAASQRGKKSKVQKTRVPINEIEELQQAMDLLFGEQQEQTNTHDRVKFKAQEQSLNPCYKDNKNTDCLKPGENYYFFQLNEMCEFLNFNEQRQPLYEDNNNEVVKEQQPSMITNMFGEVLKHTQSAQQNKLKSLANSQKNIYSSANPNLINSQKNKADGRKSSIMVQRLKQDAPIVSNFYNPSANAADCLQLEPQESDREAHLEIAQEQSDSESSVFTETHQEDSNSNSNRHGVSSGSPRRNITMQMEPKQGGELDGNPQSERDVLQLDDCGSQGSAYDLEEGARL